MKQLPKKLSTLLRWAVEDSKKVSREKGVRLDMGTWHDTFSDGSCSMCMAGAVMDQRLKVGRDKPKDGISAFEPHWDFEDQTRDKLLAINDMREGDFFGAFYRVVEDDPSPKQGRALALAKKVFNEGKTSTALGGFRKTWGTYLKCIEALKAGGL